jgi:glutaredoxin-related protein
VDVLEKQLCQQVPNIVQKSFDSIEKCLWILRKQFKFVTTSKLNLKKFTSLKQTLKMLEQMKIPVLIGVSSTHSSYDHAVVIWNGIVIDYESMYSYPLTEESLRQVCGTNTTFQKVTTGYGLFPPKNLRKKVNMLY